MRIGLLALVHVLCPSDPLQAAGTEPRAMTVGIGMLFLRKRASAELS
jgi:hypothetical protein